MSINWHPCIARGMSTKLTKPITSIAPWGQQGGLVIDLALLSATLIAPGYAPREGGSWSIDWQKHNRRIDKALDWVLRYPAVPCGTLRYPAVPCGNVNVCAPDVNSLTKVQDKARGLTPLHSTRYVNEVDKADYINSNSCFVNSPTPCCAQGCNVNSLEDQVDKALVGFAISVADCPVRAAK